MKSNGVLLAVEDNLSDAVATKILQKLGFVIVKRIGYSGYGYLKTKAKGLNQNARKPYDVFILTDLDSPNICPPELIQSWIRGPLNLGFFLRVAVMEVESWVMADQHAFAEFLQIPANQIPYKTDEILDPKQTLVSLAKKSECTSLRRDLVPSKKSKTAKIGPRYNIRLSEFVQDHWDFNRAAHISPSLKRTIDRLESAKSNPHID